MITDPQGTILALFVAFCRIGGCMMVLPGFSSGRIPPQIRLLLSAALSMAILPLLWNTIYPQVSKDTLPAAELMPDDLIEEKRNA